MTQHMMEFEPEPGLQQMTKKDYQKLAATVREMRKGMEASPTLAHGAVVDVAIEIVIARIGLMLAEDNKNFDSFVFAAACKGTKA